MGSCGLHINKLYNVCITCVWQAHSKLQGARALAMLQGKLWLGAGSPTINEKIKYYFLSTA